ncbi:ABC transporter G family member 20-like [Dermatophagoides pteronyssinus]|uniref:ABC transporter G family member 20-like n=1 Tax=Dermatophagoides pteronyssinus TaxID=6956 RepID=UPI003F68019E
MIKNPFTNHSYVSDEADVVAINDNRHASLNRFRRLTSVNETDEKVKRDPALALAKLVEKTEKNGVYVNKGLIMEDERSTQSTPGAITPTSIRPPKIAVDVRDVTFAYGFGQKSLLTLKKINVSVPQGKIYALLGSSGCGKTTLLRCVLGRLQPQSGVIRVFGQEPGSEYSPVPGPGVGYMPQELALFPDFTIKETLRYFGQLYRMSPKEIKARTKFLITLLHLPEKNRLVSQLSGGQQRRVSLASALVHRPPLLILDEPTVGVDPVLRKAIWEHLDALCREDGLTVIITTHYIEEARTAETVGLMRFGRLLVQSNPEELLVRHGLPTLEAVFLKLCQLDSAQIPESVKTDAANNTIVAYSGGSDAIETKKVDDNLPMVTVNYEKSDIERSPNNNNNDDNNNIANNNNAISLAPNTAGNLLIPMSTSFKDVSARATPSTQSPRMSFSERGSTGDFAQLQLQNQISVEGERRRMFDLNRVMALFIKNSIRLKRNVPILLFYFFLPSIQIALFCICIGQDPKNIPVAVYNAEDPPGLSAEYLSFVNPEIVVQVPYPSLEEARQAVVDGKAWAALHFSHNYSASLNQRRIMAGKADNDTIESSNIKLYLDMSNQVIGFVLLRTFFLAFQSFAQDYLSILGYNPATVTLPITIEKVIYGTVNPSMTEFMAPGVIILIAYYATTALTALSLVLERKDGLLERSLVAGVNSFEFLISHIMTQTIVLSIQEVFMLATTFYIFKVPSRGPMIWVFSLTFFQGVAGVMFGLFISSLCADEVSAAMLGMGSFFPTIMLGGIFWPIQSMPDWMASLAAFLPQTLPVESMRFILSRGWGVEYFEVTLGFIATWGWILVYLVAAAFIFKKYT